MAHPRRPQLKHPAREEIELIAVLNALGNQVRLTIVRILSEEGERPCGTFPVEVAPSTLTHHFRVLREAGVIAQREDGRQRWSALRTADLEASFPGLLDSVLTRTTLG